jgi:hypothetical protein
MAITEDAIKGNKSNLSCEIMDELKACPEVQISVWADGNNGIISFLGMCRVHLKEI